MRYDGAGALTSVTELASLGGGSIGYHFYPDRMRQDVRYQNNAIRDDANTPTATTEADKHVYRRKTVKDTSMKSISIYYRKGSVFIVLQFGIGVLGVKILARFALLWAACFFWSYAGVLLRAFRDCNKAAFPEGVSPTDPAALLLFTFPALEYGTVLSIGLMIASFVAPQP